jgi:tetratricopeptide (TPR) repeat protein
MQYEQLTFKIDVQDQASQKFEQLGKAAKEAGDKAEKAGKKFGEAFSGAQLTNMGRSLIGFAATGVREMGKLINASSDLYEAQNFAKQIFADSTPVVLEFAKNAARAVGQSTEAAIQGASSIGIFGRAIGITGDDLANFSTDLVTLAADMASVKNSTPERAITAIGAAFRGQYRPIKDFGVILNEQVLKQAAFNAGIYDGTGKLTQREKTLAVNAELFKQLDFAQGDFQRTAGEAANQQRIFNAELENARASLGDALRPAFTKAIEGAISFLEIVQKIPGPLKEIGATIGVSVVGFAALAGGLLFVGGKVLSAVESFKKLKLALDGMGSAGAGLGKLATGLGVVAVEMAAVQIAAEGINAISGEAKKAANSFDDFAIALKKGDISGTLETFGHMAEHSDKTLKGFLGLGGIIEDAGRSFSVAGVKYKANIEDWDRSFDKILAKSPEDAAGLIEALRKSSEGLDQNSQQYKDQMDMIDRYEPKVKKAVDVQLANGNAQALSTDLMKKYGDQTLVSADSMADFAQEQEDAEKAVEDFDKMIDKLVDNLAEAEDAFDTAGERAEVFGDVLGDTTGVDAHLQNLASIRGSIQDVVDALKDEDDHLDKNKVTLDTHTEAGRANVAALQDLASAIQDDLVRAYKDSNGSAEKVIHTAQGYTDELKLQLTQAGLTETQIKTYTEALNLTPEDIATTIHLEKQEEARQKLELLKIEMDKIPPEIATQIIAKVDEGDYIAAYGIAKQYITDQGPAPIAVKPVAKISDAEIVKGQYDYYYSQHPIQAPVKLNVQGGVGNVPYGPQVPGRSVSGQAARPPSPAEAAAMESMGLTAIGATLVGAPAPAPVAAGTYGPISTAPIINLTVNMAAGTNEARVVDLLRQFARSNGIALLGRR